MTKGNKGVQQQHRAQRRRGCTGKVPFDTQERAENGRRVAMRLFKDKQLHTYHCPDCGYYHLGH